VRAAIPWQVSGLARRYEDSPCPARTRWSHRACLRFRAAELVGHTPHLADDPVGRVVAEVVRLRFGQGAGKTVVIRQFVGRAVRQVMAEEGFVPIALTAEELREVENFVTQRRRRVGPR
jgi:hypothetical protein